MCQEAIFHDMNPYSILLFVIFSYDYIIHEVSSILCILYVSDKERAGIRLPAQAPEAYQNTPERD